MRYFKVILALGFILAIVPNFSLAQEQSNIQHDAVTSATPKLGPDEVVITGKIAHADSLFIEKIINPQGKSIDELKGKIYQFLPNAESNELVKDNTYIGKTIILVGKIDPKANTVEVRFFKEKKEEGK